MTSKSRPTRNETMMAIACEISKRSTCQRRAVGCVLTDKYGRILSIGHNGVPRGLPHCLDVPCIGVTEPPGYHLDSCLAVHAEINALLFCKDIMDIHTCYTTVSPCIQCIKALLQSSCELIVFEKVYDWKTVKLWIDNGRKIQQLKRKIYENEERASRPGKTSKDETDDEHWDTNERSGEDFWREPTTDT